MAFTTRRGRPPKPRETQDFGTPELRFKQAHGLTSEPIDLCLEQQLITAAQHRSGLHLRWLYTLRYGAPSLTTRYADREGGSDVHSTPEWRILREQEYQEASRLLKSHRHYEPVMRLTVYNERPSFLSAQMRVRAWDTPALAERLAREHEQLCAGLQLLVKLWRSPTQTPEIRAPQPLAFS